MNKELVASALEKMRYGFDTFSSTLLDFSNEKENDILIDVCNGNTEEGYACSVYPFNLSFDEEAANLYSYVELFISNQLNLTIDNKKEREYEIKDFPNLIVKALYGLKCMVEGMEEVYTLNKEHKELVELLKVTLIDEENYSYESIFKNGLYSMLRKTKGFKRAYIKEVKELVGRYEFEKMKKEYNQFF